MIYKKNNSVQFGAFSACSFLCDLSGRVRLENNFWLAWIFIVPTEERKINKHFLAL